MVTLAPQTALESERVEGSWTVQAPAGVGAENGQARTAFVHPGAVTLTAIGWTFVTGNGVANVVPVSAVFVMLTLGTTVLAAE